jgi:hypothetical protein
MIMLICRILYSLWHDEVLRGWEIQPGNLGILKISWKRTVYMLESRTSFK